MTEEKEPVCVSIHKIELDEVVFDEVGPLEIRAIAQDVESRMEKISKEKNTFDTFKLLAYTALYYAVQSYTKANSAGSKNKDDGRQLDNAIEKLSNCLNRLPLK
jgi:hypothetical protein